MIFDGKRSEGSAYPSSRYPEHQPVISVFHQLRGTMQEASLPRIIIYRPANEKLTVIVVSYSTGSPFKQLGL
jgi:hypothetical protein